MLALSAERVVERIAERHATDARFTKADARAALLVLIDVIEQAKGGEPVRDFTEYSWSAEAPLLLASLRRELLSNYNSAAGDAGELVQILVAVDRVERLLADEIASRFSHQLSGAQSLPLLVEVVHDMRSPLTAILFLIERLQQGQSGPVSTAQQRHLALVYSAAFGLNSLTSDLMELARGGKRLLDEAPRRFSVSEMLRSVRNLVQPLAEEKKLSVRFSGPPIDRRVGQPAVLSRVLLNLTTNAFKFTTVGSVTVLVEQQADVNELTFIVEDTGCGIPDAGMDEVFSTFTEIAALKEGERTMKFSSSGLGLAICYKLVAAMGGTLRVDSRVDSGTRMQFTLRLPPA
ncbi:MAG: HAMP domain-containing sensor histidine kinase [Gemmatimonadaceae bacterium]